MVWTKEQRAEKEVATRSSAPLQDSAAWGTTLWLQSWTWLCVWAYMQEQRQIKIFFLERELRETNTVQVRSLSTMLRFMVVLFLLRGRKTLIFHLLYYVGFCGGSDGKASACNVRDPGSITGSGKSPGEENVYSLQYSCLENSMDRGACWATVHGVTKSQKWLSIWACMHARKKEIFFFFLERELRETNTAQVHRLSTRVMIYGGAFSG